MTRLSVNLNKVALLRNSRTIGIPSVTRAAAIAIGAGAAGITVHPRPDGRHIRTADVHDLKALLAAHPGVEFNIEGNPFEAVLDLVLQVVPHQFTLVPDEPAAVTSDHGWDLARDGARLAPIVDRVRARGIRVSLFMDPDPAAIPRARELGADRVELYTEPYARAFGGTDQSRVLESYAAAARAAVKCGLGVNAGHDLNQLNLPAFVATVPGVQEVSIGHALIADAIEHGLARTVEGYLDAIRRGAQGRKG